MQVFCLGSWAPVCKRGEQQQQDVVMAVVLMISGKQQQLRACGRWLPAVEWMQAALQASMHAQWGAFTCIDSLQQVLMHSFVCAWGSGLVCIH